MYQKQYWAEMLELRAHQYYLGMYQLSSERWERWIKVFLAVTSSASIGAWAIWHDYGIVWGSLISASQVVSVVYPYLPFKTRIKPISGAVFDLGLLADDVERDWYEVSEGYLTEAEINDKNYKIKQQKNKILNRHFGTVVMPVKNRFKLQSELMIKQYFNKFLQES